MTKSKRLFGHGESQKRSLVLHAKLLQEVRRVFSNTLSLSLIIFIAATLAVLVIILLLSIVFAVFAYMSIKGTIAVSFNKFLCK